MICRSATFHQNLSDSFFGSAYLFSNLPHRHSRLPHFQDKVFADYISRFYGGYHVIPPGSKEIDIF
jgi:hypothetical protein